MDEKEINLDAKKQAEDILQQALQKAFEKYPDDLKASLLQKRLPEKLDGLVSVQSQGDNLVMGLTDLNLNQYVTLNVLSLAALLAGLLEQELLTDPKYAPLSTAVSVSIFIMEFLNLIQPRLTVDLDVCDARAYCALLNIQRERPVNEIIPYEQAVDCIRKVDGEMDISRCLGHLGEKRLIRRTGGGFLVIREVKVKAV